MAQADVIELLKPWTQSSEDARKKQAKVLEAGIDHRRERKSDIFGRIKKGGEITSLKKEWMEATTYQNKVTASLSGTTMTFSGYLLGAAISAESMRQHIKGRVILERDDGVQAIVSDTPGDVNYTALTAVVAAHGNTVLSDDATPTQWTILAPAVSEYDDSFIPNAIDRRFRWCSTQIVKYNYEQPWSKQSILMEGGIGLDEMGYQIKELTNNLYQKQALAVLRSRPQYSGGQWKDAYSIANSTLHGMCFWPDLTQSEMANPNVYINMASDPIDPDTMNNIAHFLMYDELADYNSGDWVFAMHPTQSQYISEFGKEDRRFEYKDNKYGYRVQTFGSKVGKDFELLVDPNMRADTILLVDLSAFSWGYVKGQGVKVTDLAEDNTLIYKKKITAYMWGTMVRNPRAKVAKIYGLPTSYT